MAFHLAHIHDYERFLSIDVGSFRVRVGVYALENSELQELSHASVRQNRKHFRDTAIVDMRGVTQTIEQAIIQASQSLDVIPEHAILSFSSWDLVYDSMTTQYMRVDTDAVLTMQELDTMIKRIESQSYARAREKAKRQKTIFLDDLRLVSSTIVSVSIDGKKVLNPLGMTGARVTLNLLNIFAPSSEFNILRSIVASIDKKIISLIPTPLILPKIIEVTSYAQEPSCIIDIWYMHTSVIVMENNEIKTFASFSVWSQMLMEMIHDLQKHFSFLHIENILTSEQEMLEEWYQKMAEDFFEYILDVIWAYLENENIHITFKNLFLHGSIFENPVLFKVFWGLFETYTAYALRKKRINSLLPRGQSHDESITYGLSLTASELLLVKKDPLIRILRYILYSYE